MTAFPPSILEYWGAKFGASVADERVACGLVVCDELPLARPVMILERSTGATRVVLRHGIAEVINVQGFGEVSTDKLRDALMRAGVSLHDPDHLFYLPNESAPSTMANEDVSPRKLTNADRVVFEAFNAGASERDKEDSWVELDHWAVFGCFDGDRLVCAASMNLWDDSPIADLGVLTLPDARGKGFARTVVQAINRFARQKGYEPQYRCQLDNHASIALARSCGLTLFGHWTVATDRSEAVAR